MAKVFKSKALQTMYLDGSLDEVMYTIQEAKEWYTEYTNLRLEWEQDPYEDSWHYHLYGDRLETDEEEKARMDWEEKFARDQEKQEREMLERLLKKFKSL